MDGNKVVNATFVQDLYSLTVNVVGIGNVTVVPDLALYPSGTVVELTAVAGAGWSFSGWSGDLSGSVNPETIVMDGDKSVTATFDVVNTPPDQPQLSITPSLVVGDNNNLVVTVTGPTLADPEGDAVTYTYKWFVDSGTGEFLDDEVAGRWIAPGAAVCGGSKSVGATPTLHAPVLVGHIGGHTAAHICPLTGPPNEFTGCGVEERSAPNTGRVVFILVNPPHLQTRAVRIDVGYMHGVSVSQTCCP